MWDGKEQGGGRCALKNGGGLKGKTIVLLLRVGVCCLDQLRQ